MREFVRVVPMQHSIDEHQMMNRRPNVAPRFWLPSELAVAWE
jgi:hypothetical protein